MMENKKPRLSTFVVIGVIVIITIFLAFYLKHQIDSMVYEERRESLTQLIENSANSINDNVTNRWEIAEVYQKDLEDHIQEYDKVEDYLNHLHDQLSSESDCYFLVDSIGKYYCSDGHNGRIVDTHYFLDSSDKRLEYLGTLPHIKDENTYIIFRTRLDTPIEVNSENGSAEITYCCLMYNIDTLSKHIGNIFGSQNNNIIIFDRDSGNMLYKQFGIGLLVDGYNVYQKYSRINIEYDLDPNIIIENIKNKQSSVIAMNLDNNTYYICESPLNISNWSIMMVIQGAYFDKASDSNITSILTSVFSVILAMALLALTTYVYFNKMRVNQKLMENEIKVNEALKDAYKTKSNFLSYMSHDIRTPINGIIGMSSIGIANSNDQSKVEDCFKKIDLSSKHLLAIVNDVLDMSAIESDKVVIQEEMMNIETTVNSCLDIIKGSLNNRDLKIESKVNIKTKDVIGDEFHLKQIIINILSNAVKFTNDGGFVKLSLDELNEDKDIINYQIIVEDSGIGMSEEFMKHIFEAFKQANPNARTNYKGTGLGMAISSEYVKLMGGTIDVESKLNEGTKFIVTLPFKKKQKVISDIKLEDLNVLLVEDNELNLEIAKAMLIDKVKKLSFAYDGKQALDTYLNSKENEFDLILMDVMMPIMNGLESTKAIRKTERKDNNLPIIALTANTYKDDIDAIYEAGMNDYLNKPFTLEQLIEKISRRKINEENN